MNQHKMPSRAVPFNVPVAKPSFDKDEERLVCETLRSGWVTQGPRVAEFEQKFAAYVVANEAVAVNSCTNGLTLALHSLGVGVGDEVIVPSWSFIATANSIVHSGATPVFVDIDPENYNMVLVFHPANITPEAEFALDQYLLA